MVMIWIGICIAAIVIELITPTALVCIWFAAGSLIAMLAALINLPMEAQIISFVIVSVVSMLIVRPIAARYLRGNTVATNADRLIGMSAIVISRITKEEWGEVKINGAIWHAIPAGDEYIDVNETVKIIAIEGAKLIVKKVG